MHNRNRDWRTVPLPQRMQTLEKDVRGLPIPFLVMRDNEGTAHFTINDHEKHALCLREDRCAICSQKLLRGRWFVGGPLSAFHEHGCYIDTPLHQECMEYALQVCPYLAAPKYTGRLDDLKVDYSKIPAHVLLVDPTMIPERPPLFVAVMAAGQKVWRNGLQTYVKPVRRPGNKPYLAQQFWLHGERLPDAIGIMMTNEALSSQTA